ncbi:urease accessory protein UreD [Enterovibrio norvegicus]|uniref:urease accessory protein UreD n=1 Tax=Enterovibrio norvegicus TaxID=188144 RepID=UPI000C86273C|nr:urease accessory protein UreD [Enterovibrio norvegicus]PML78701.1 urease accessory protein UreD [Enterovibrio norvegicus]
MTQITLCNDMAGEESNEATSSVTSLPAASVPARGWEAELVLGYEVSRDKTVLRHSSHRGPLAIQRALYPEGGVCHSHLLHPPGGVVGGDSLNVNVCVSAGAEVLLTTPGATRFYRSDGRVANLEQHFTVGEHARLEWVPLENIAFPGAILTTQTDFRLSTTSQFIGWDIWTLGQPATETPFGNGDLNGLTRVFIDDTLILCERLRVNPETQRFSASSLRDHPVCSTLIMYDGHRQKRTSDETEQSLCEQSLCEQLVEWWESERENVQQKDPSIVFGFTDCDGLLIVRGLGEKTEALFEVYTRIWQKVRHEWTGITPAIPRIWRT